MIAGTCSDSSPAFGRPTACPPWCPCESRSSTTPAADEQAASTTVTRSSRPFRAAFARSSAAFRGSASTAIARSNRLEGGERGRPDIRADVDEDAPRVDPVARAREHRELLTAPCPEELPAGRLVGRRDEKHEPLGLDGHIAGVPGRLAEESAPLILLAPAERMTRHARMLRKRRAPHRCRKSSYNSGVAEGRRERKVVTVLFADLVGFTSRAEQLDPEDVAAELTRYHGHLRAELERHGGTVEKFIGDAVMALFGAPTTHEDDAERAVRAAFTIRDWALDQGVEVRIGVNTGEALVSVDAHPETGESMAAGDVINTGARLQSAAPVNSIVVGEQTFRSTERAIDYREIAPVEAKGKSQPVSAWEAVQPRARFAVERVHGATLVGRRREVDLLEGALARVLEERSSQLVTIVGVPGIGKSRLVLELYEVIERLEELISWRYGRCLPYGEGITFWALGEMVKAQLGILEGDDDAEAERKLTDAVADSWVRSHLRPLVGLTGAAEGGGDKRDEAFAAWRRYFEELAAERPLVLVFEDLHWADDNLLEFLDHLVDWAAGVPLLVVCTARPELLTRRPDWGGGKPNALTVSLPSLSDDDTARLLAELLGSVLPAETQVELLARAGGNPLYAEEFARMLRDRGTVGELPETVQGLIAARLDLLEPEQKSLLQDGAVIGKRFWVGGLAALADRPDLEAGLHSLERKEFVRRERSSTVETDSEYSFRHLLVRDVAYGQIPRAVRAEKHLLAARWVEQLGRREDHAEMLAHHYLQALELTTAAGGSTEAFADAARGR